MVDFIQDPEEAIIPVQKFEPQEAASISCGLQKTVFAYERERATGKPIEPIVRHPRKKTQHELWDEFLPEENLELGLLSYDREESAEVFK